MMSSRNEVKLKSVDSRPSMRQSMPSTPPFSPIETPLQDSYCNYQRINHSMSDENKRLRAERNRARDEIQKSYDQMKVWQKKCSAIEAEAIEAIANQTKKYELKFTEFNNYVKQSTEAKGLLQNQMQVMADELQTEKMKSKTLEANNKCLKSINERLSLRVRSQIQTDAHFEQRVAEEQQKNKAIIDQMDAINKELETTNQNLQQQIQILNQSVSQSNNKSAPIKRSKRSTKILNLRSERSKAKDSLKYFKTQNEINKRKQITYRYKYLEFRRLYGTVVKKYFKIGSNGIREVVEKIILSAKEFSVEAEHKNRKECEDVLTEHKLLIQSIESGAQRSEQILEDDSVNCPKCELTFGDSAKRERHLTIKHLLSDSNVEEIELD